MTDAANPASAQAYQVLARKYRPETFADLVGQKKAKDIAPEDIFTGSEIMLSVFIRDPQFQSQTKDRLTSPEAARMVERGFVTMLERHGVQKLDAKGQPFDPEFHQAMASEPATPQAAHSVAVAQPNSSETKTSVISARPRTAISPSNKLM